MIVKTEYKTDYTKVSNAFIRNETLSINAKMVGILLLSLPNAWNVNVNYLAKMLSVGETTIRKAIKELIDNAIIKRMQGKTKGRFNEEMYYEFIEKQEQEFLIKEEEITEPKTLENLEFNYNLNQPLQEQQQVEEVLKEPKNSDFHRLIESPITENVMTYKDRVYYKKRESILTQSQKIINLSNLFRKPKKDIELNFNDFSKQELESIQAFFAYRKEKQRKLALSTKKSILDNLRRLKEEGEDIIKIIQTSINRGWSGLFKENKSQSFMPKSKKPSVKEINKELSKEQEEHNLIMQLLPKLSAKSLDLYEQGEIAPVTIGDKIRYIQKQGELATFIA